MAAESEAKSDVANLKDKEKKDAAELARGEKDEAEKKKREQKTKSEAEAAQAEMETLKREADREHSKAGTAKRLSVEEQKEVDELRRKLVPLKEAYEQAKHASKTAQHEIRIKTGQAAKDSKYSDYERE